MSIPIIPDNSFDITTVRNQNVSGGVAGIYNPCRTILNEHTPVCRYEAFLYGKYLDVTDNPDVWFPLPDTGSIAYLSKNLTLTTAVGVISAVRVVLNTYAYPITSNFIEVTTKIVSSVAGVGGSRTSYIGFASAFSAPPITERACFLINAPGLSFIGYRGGSIALTACPLGRDLATGDICTVRLDRQEGSANIDIARFYVNGQKQYETTAIPQANCYAGIGVYGDASVTTARKLTIDYFGFRYVP
jgi:hypothetical protein